MSETSWMIDQLVQQGVKHFCIAPGSRSTPLVLAAASLKQVKLHVHYDERGLGFFALGLSQALREPAAIICTSGTALGNLLPAVMEAHHSCTPLILLTADRPAELRDCGANQATDQVKIFHPFVRWQVDLPSCMEESYLRSVMAQGYFYSRQNPPGPVHINCSFREPLYKKMDPVAGIPLEIDFPKQVSEPYKCTYSKGLILIGKLPNPDDIHPILKLGERLNWPVCADILSNARSFPTPQQIRYFDWVQKPNPDFVLHFGERLTSKKILSFLKTASPKYIHVSPFPFLQDPERILTGRVQSDIPEFCKQFEAPSNDQWITLWEDIEPQFEEGGVFTEVHAMRQLSNLLPENFGVFLGNGMPVRDGDHFLFPKNCKGFFANRGLSGIDGNIATIAGLAEKMPILGVIGDQAALYDLNSLALLKKTKYPVVLLISNNFGGGIFHHLPVSDSPNFEKLWAAHHNFHFQQGAEMFGLPYFIFAYIEQVFKMRKSVIVELITCRKVNHQYQQKITVVTK